MSDHLSQTVDIETPELVVVSYTIAGLGSRVYAAIIDLFICIAMYLGVIFGIVFLLARGDREPDDTQRDAVDGVGGRRDVPAAVRRSCGATTCSSRDSATARRPASECCGFAPCATAATRSASRRRPCAISCASSTCSRRSAISSASAASRSRSRASGSATSSRERSSFAKRWCASPSRRAVDDGALRGDRRGHRPAHRRRVRTARAVERATQRARARQAPATRRAGRRPSASRASRRTRVAARARALLRLLATERRAREHGRGGARRHRREPRALRDRHHALAALDRVRGEARRRAAARTQSARRERRARLRRRVSRAVRRPRAAADRGARPGRARSCSISAASSPARTTCCTASGAPASTDVLRFIAIDVPTEVRRSVRADRDRGGVHVRSGGHRVHGRRARSSRRAGVHPDADARPRRGRRAARASNGDGYIPDPQVFRPGDGESDHREQRAGDVRRVRRSASPPVSARCCCCC